MTKRENSIFVGIIKYPGSNAQSVVNAFARLGIPCIVSTDITVIRDVTHIVIPGQGEASTLMGALRSAQLTEYLAETEKPILGICLGMQALFEHSEEGETPLLGISPGSVRRLTKDKQLPHTGWASVRYRAPGQFFKLIPNGEYFYFLHSYRAPSCDFTVAEVAYGNEVFPAAVVVGRRVGVQFHPEKSGAAGAQFLQNFIEAQF